jgi:chromosome partitioning protein
VTSKAVQQFLKTADLVVMPVLPSIFDEGATRRFLKKVDELKPIRKGRKPLAVVANRVRANTRAARELDEFLGGLGHEVATRFADRAIYQDVARRGLGIFDLTPSRRAGAVEDWLPLIRLIEEQV